MARLVGRHFFATATFVACAITGASSVEAQDKYKLRDTGKLTIATTAEMPGIVPQDGKLVGYDGEILQIIADRLGLELNPVKLEWSGVIASVQAGRMDVLGGNVGWTEERTKILALTEPTQYFQNGIMQKNGRGMSRPARLVGH